MARTTAKPKFRPAETWAGCPRCGARVRYSSLRRERLTGLLVCTESSGRGTRPCWDPWPEVYDFQVYSDKSIEPPPEPMPARWNLDNIWGNGPSGDGANTAVMAAGPTAAPDDATRLRALLTSVPYYHQLGRTASFTPMTTRGAEIQNVTTIIPASYDGTFLPSNSVRTVTPPDEGAELAAITTTDHDTSAPLHSPPWSVVKGV